MFAEKLREMLAQKCKSRANTLSQQPPGLSPGREEEGAVQEAPGDLPTSLLEGHRILLSHSTRPLKTFPVDSLLSACDSIVWQVLKMFRHTVQ